MSRLWWLKSTLWWMKCILKILKCFGAPMMTGWNGCLISMLIHPGRNVRVFYFFCMSTVICLLVRLIVSCKPLWASSFIFLFDTMKKIIKIRKKSVQYSWNQHLVQQTCNTLHVSFSEPQGFFSPWYIVPWIFLWKELSENTKSFWQRQSHVYDFCWNTLNVCWYFSWEFKGGYVHV